MGSYLINEIIINPSVFVFLVLYFTRFMLVISCKDWFLIWFRLEINIIRFIILIYVKYRILNIESCIKYFFIQRLGSVIFLIYIYIEFNIFSYVGRVLLCYKIGGGPFYFWFPSICIRIGWWSCFMLITLQKIIPIILISLFTGGILWLIRLIRLLIGVIGRINQVELKQLMAFSSIHHIGWILIRFIVRDEFWIVYLFLYRIILLGWIEFLENKVVRNIMRSVKYNNKWILLLILLNLGGVPPLLGFFLKWWSFYYFLIFEYRILILLLIFSVIILYIYFRIIYDLVIGGIIIFSWILKITVEKLVHYDIIVIIRLCIGILVGIIFI